MDTPSAQLDEQLKRTTDVAHITDEAVDARMVALMRCLLALSAMLIVFLASPSTAGTVAITYAALSAYSLYSIALCLAIYHGQSFVPSRAQYWVDVACYTVLIAVTHSVSTVFFPFYLFAILVASFSRGSREGFMVTGASVALFLIADVSASPQGLWELDRSFVRSIYLFLLGYMISHWGGHELLLRRRLRFLSEISTPANPRLGVDHAVARNLRQVLEFFGAETCLLTLSRRGESGRLLYRVERKKAFAALAPDEMSEELATTLTALPQDLLASFNASGGRLMRGASYFAAWDRSTGTSREGSRLACERLANLLETPAFATVPYKQSEGISGRLYVLGKSRISEPDTEFLGQVALQIGTAVNNVMLLEEITASAAQQERYKISRDIHDTTVQSYIGLKLGLEALYRTVGDDNSASARIKELLDMATLTVDDVRGYVDRLRSQHAGQPNLQLVATLEEQVRRYGVYHGIEVNLKVPRPLKVSERIAGDVYQIVSEALSNVRRHTEAKRASVELRCDSDVLTIEVANDSPLNCPPGPFAPKSIQERAMSLGGTVHVNRNRAGSDVVKVHIPTPVSAQP